MKEKTLRLKSKVILNFIKLNIITVLHVIDNNNKINYLLMQQAHGSLSWTNFDLVKKILTLNLLVV